MRAVIFSIVILLLAGSLEGIAGFGQPMRWLKDDEIEAVRFNKQEVLLRKMQRPGFDVNADLEQSTLLCTAVVCDNLEMAQILLNAGANPNKKTIRGQMTPLASAVGQRPGTPMVRLLLQHGADPALKAGVLDETPLQRAFCAQNFPVLQALISYGAPVDMAALTLIHSACLMKVQVDPALTAAQGMELRERVKREDLGRVKDQKKSLSSLNFEFLA